MDYTSKTLHDSYFPTRTAAPLVKPGASVETYIEAGLKATLQTMVNLLQAEYEPETITFGVPGVSSHMNAFVEGEIGWNPDPTKKGYLGVFIGPDQFDLSKANFQVHMEMPNGKSYNKSYGLGRAWLDKPTRVNGKQFANTLKREMDSFFLSIENV